MENSNDEHGAAKDADASELRVSPEAWLRSVIAGHEHLLLRYAQQFVGEDRARDVVQDVFMKLCDHAHQRDNFTGRQITKWLYRVCRNRAIDVSRKENRMKSAPPEDLDTQLEASVADPASRVMASEQQFALLHQISKLTANQQEVLRLKFHGGLSYQEIAEVTGLSRTNVGYLLHTALSALRQRIEPES